MANAARDSLIHTEMCAHTHHTFLSMVSNSIPITHKYEALSQIDVRSGLNEILSDDAAKVLDTAVENEFDACKVRYVGTGTAGYGVTTNGTATLTCTSHFNQYHLKSMVDYMYQTLRCDPYDGDNFMAIMTTDAMRNLYDDLEAVMQYTKFPASGEVGKYYDTRFVRTNHAMSNAMGASSAYGEMYLFGKRDPVMRGVAEKLRVIPKEEADFGRSKGLAWYCIEGYRLIYSHDPSSNMMKFCSA